MHSRKNRSPIKKAHKVGSSVVVTIDPIHVRRLQIDEDTFFEEKAVENGILLQMRKISYKRNEITPKI